MATTTATKGLLMLLLLSLAPAYLRGQSQGPITHVIFVIKENRSTDELFGTLPGVHNYCQGGNSPLRQTTDQSISCTGVGTRSGNGYCEPIECITPDDPEGHCSVGDTCPQITVGTQANGTSYNLVLQDPTVTYPAPPHQQTNFITELAGGKMRWQVNSGGLAYYTSAQIPYYYSLATTYGLADNHFSTVGGFSLPNHAYLVAASSNEVTGSGTIQAGSNTDPGTRIGWTNVWTCGAKHGGSSAPYTYPGTRVSTSALDSSWYYGGTCTSHPSTSCVCHCAPGNKCNNTFDPSEGGTPCSTDATCNALGDTCSIAQTIGGTPGSACLVLTTIFDQIESVLGAGPNSWGYYSLNTQWNAAAYFQNLYFDNTRWNAHVHQDTQFDTDVGNCTGMCSNNHATACTLDAQCGGGSCIDSDGTPPGSKMCILPKVTYLSATAANASDHDLDGPLLTGEFWTLNRLGAFFHNPYVYYHSILFVTWDDWGGYWDHVPPPFQDHIPSLGFRVPLICVGPYCRNRITHTQFEFASVLKCMEGVFGLPAINARDASAIDACAGTGSLTNNTDGMVNLAQTPIPAIGQTLDPTTTSLQSSPSPSTYGQPVTFTANVTSTSGSPTGTVTFFDGGSPIGTGSLSQGGAALITSGLQGGTHSVTAAYGGDPIFAASTSSVLSQVVKLAASTTTLQSSQNPSVFGQPVTFTATVNGGVVTPTGNVTFSDGATNLGTSPLSNGQATITTSSLSNGSHSITASYTGDSDYLSSTSVAFVETVSNSVTSTTLTSSPNPSVYGQSMNFAAKVSGFGSTPTGSVTFNDGAIPLGIASLVNGTATLNHPSLTVASHSITAVYSGDSNNVGSTSAPLTQTVNQANTSTALASNPNPSVANQSVTFTATVTSQYGGAVSGSVTFKQGATSLSTVALANGQASYSTSFATAGMFSITAVYSGDSNNQSSTSAPMAQTVNQATTTTALVSSLNPSYANQPVTFTASVTPQYGGPVSGSVTFKQGSTSLSTIPVASAQASYTTSFSAGTYSITALYSGDSNNLSSSSAPSSQFVNPLPAPTTTALTTSGTPTYYGHSVIFTASVTAPYGPIPDGHLITFLDGSTTLGSVPTAGGVATYTTASLSVAGHTIKAMFVGDATFASSTRSVSQVVNKDPSVTALHSNLNPSNSGQAVTFTAMVNSTFGSIPDGELVTFYDGTTTLGSVPLTSGVAAYTTSSLSVAGHTIKATYAGDATFASSTKSITQEINP